MAETEGVIKYRLDFTRGPASPRSLIDSINAWRRILYQLELVGSDPNRYGGLGFGNVSRRVRAGEPAFVISGTQTGHLPALGPAHYCLVSHCDPHCNAVTAQGPIRPSSEALTHGALYDADPGIQCVLHVHSPDIWNQAQRPRSSFHPPGYRIRHSRNGRGGGVAGEQSRGATPGCDRHGGASGRCSGLRGRRRSGGIGAGGRSGALLSLLRPWVVNGQQGLIPIKTTSCDPDSPPVSGRGDRVAFSGCGGGS